MCRWRPPSPKRAYLVQPRRGVFGLEAGWRLKGPVAVPILGSDGTQEEAGGKGDDDTGHVPYVR